MNLLTKIVKFFLALGSIALTLPLMNFTLKLIEDNQLTGHAQMYFIGITVMLIIGLILQAKALLNFDEFSRFRKKYNINVTEKGMDRSWKVTFTKRSAKDKREYKNGGTINRFDYKENKDYSKVKEEEVGSGATYELTFGKNKGKQLQELDVKYIGWLKKLTDKPVLQKHITKMEKEDPRFKKNKPYMPKNGIKEQEYFGMDKSDDTKGRTWK